MKHFLRSQWHESRNQPQFKNSEAFKYMEVNSMLLNKEQIINEINEEIRKVQGDK